MARLDLTPHVIPGAVGDIEWWTGRSTKATWLSALQASGDPAIGFDG